MQPPLLFDIQRRPLEQRRWNNIREYAAEMLRRHDERNAKSRAIPPLNDVTTALVQADNEGNGEFDVFQQTLAHFNSTANVPQASVNVLPADVNHRVQRTALQTERIEHVEIMDGILPQQAPVSFLSSTPPKTMTVEMNAGTQGAPIIDHRWGYDGQKAQGLLTQIRPSSAPVHSTASLRLPLPNTVIPGSFDGSRDAGGVKPQDNLSARTRVNNSERQTYLDSCLKAMYDPDCTDLTHSLANMHLRGSENEVKQLSKKTSKSTKASSKNKKKKAQKPTAGVSKKGKQGDKEGLPKKKEFVCQYDGCGKAFERRYNLKVHTRRHTGEMPYTCPKTDEGCFLYFRWRSSLRHHLKTVHNGVVPIAQNNTGGSRTPAIPVVQGIVDAPAANSGIYLSASTGASSSSTTSAGSSRSQLSARRTIQKTSSKKSSKVRKNFPAVAARQPTAEELARAQMTAALKAKAQDEIVAEEASQIQVEQTDSNQENESMDCSEDATTQPSLSECDLPSDDSLDVSAFLISEKEEAEAHTSPGSDTEDDPFDGMDVDVPADLALPTLRDQPVLPSPEGFFCKN